MSTSPWSKRESSDPWPRIDRSRWCPITRRGARRSRWASSEPELFGDDHLHDLVGAREDSLHARVHVGAGDRVLAHVPLPSEELQAGVDDPLVHLADPELGHRALLDEVLARDVIDQQAVEERAADLDLRRTL